MALKEPKLESLSVQEALQILCGYLLGKDYYIVDPVHCHQGNAIIVDDILKKYSRQYRKELKQYRKSIEAEERLKAMKENSKYGIKTYPKKKEDTDNGDSE